MHSQSWIGLDIGGANIKVGICRYNSELSSSTNRIESQSIPFALWKQPERLASKLAELFASFPGRPRGIAITMTGELADCYRHRQVGVESIVDAVTEAIESTFTADPDPDEASDPSASIPHPVFYGIGQLASPPSEQNHQWHDTASAKVHWSRVAAANWHAIASSLKYLLGLNTPLNGFLIDMGSTTTDIIPIRDGLPAATGLTDLSRLQSGELYYGGAARTPICSLVQSLQIGSHSATIARELFATIEDAFLVLGDISAEVNRTDTADGRPFTWNFACQRLAKMVGADADLGGGLEGKELRESFLRQGDIGEDSIKHSLSELELQSIAQQVVSALRDGIVGSINCVVAANSDLPSRFFLSGQGAWFVSRILREQFGSAEIHCISNQLGEHSSEAMGAVAVASLAAAELPNPNLNTNLPLRDLATSRRQQETARLRVIKIGGSLLDWPSSPEAIQRWLSDQSTEYKNIWMVGGGKIVDSLRDFHANFPMHDSVSHWLALDAMSFNLRLVGPWFPDWPVHHEWASTRDCLFRSNCRNVWFDFSTWLKQNSDLAQTLPETWDVTSDSCAAFLAQHIGATDLVLLKSCSLPSNLSMGELAELGVVDPQFLNYAHSIEHVKLMNLRV